MSQCQHPSLQINEQGVCCDCGQSTNRWNRAAEVFEALAVALKANLQATQTYNTTPEGTAHNAAYEIADVCARFNPNFDRARFLAACGVEG